MAPVPPVPPRTEDTPMSDPECPDCLPLPDHGENPELIDEGDER